MKGNKILISLAVFSIAMGFMETAVVVYLREIYYPEGFAFPLQPIDKGIAVTEILREAATIIMLICTGIFTGRSKTEKFGFFIYCFGIWDISYYLFLYLLLGWPESLLTWDILFLIPVTWVGPVIRPVINSFTMVTLGILIRRFTILNPNTFIHRNEWIGLITGSLIVILSYTLDYSKYMLEKFTFKEMLWSNDSTALFEHAGHYIPESFPWWIFIAGQIILLIVLGRFYFRNIHKLK
ncbi:MAG: hypothetical protein ACNA7V_09560 [Bacteroidales bacterium]